MTGTQRSSDGLDPRRRKILFRAWHRGTREMDLLLGRFADAYIADLDEPDLAMLEALMEVPEPDLFAWFTGREPVPQVYATELYDTILTFHMTRRE